MGLETGHVLAIDTKGELVTDRSCASSNTFCTGKQSSCRTSAPARCWCSRPTTTGYALIVETSYPIRASPTTCARPDTDNFPNTQ